MSRLKMTAIGFLGHSCTIKNVNGMNAITFSVACTERWKDKDGNQMEATTWVDCTLWRKPESSAIAEFLKKGTQVYVDGKPTARGYNSKTDPEKIIGVLNLRVDTILFLSSAKPAATSTATVVDEGVSSGNATPAETGFAVSQEDDLPF